MQNVTLLHEPHYVLPPLVPCRAVVTIHDCIHLMFPQYLPNRLAYAYARANLWAAAKRAERIFTVSETSKADILRYCDVPAERIIVVYNAIDDRFATPPDPEDVNRVRERYQLNGPFVAVRGQHQAAQEPRTPDRRLRSRPARRIRAARTADHRRPDLEVPAAAPRRGQAQAAQARALPRVRGGRHAGGAVPAGDGVRLPLALRGFRPAAARGDGQRHARGDVEPVVAAGSGRRRRRAGRSRTVRCRWRKASSRC